MKLPTLTSLPKYRRFTFEPRYYDPIKEEVELKEKSAKRLLYGADKKQNAENMQLMKDRISGSFKRKANDTKRSFLIQVVIAIGLTLLFLAIFQF